MVCLWTVYVILCKLTLYACDDAILAWSGDATCSTNGMVDSLVAAASVTSLIITLPVLATLGIYRNGKTWKKKITSIIHIKLAMFMGSCDGPVRIFYQ